MRGRLPLLPALHSLVISVVASAPSCWPQNRHQDLYHAHSVGFPIYEGCTAEVIWWSVCFLSGFISVHNADQALGRRMQIRDGELWKESQGDSQSKVMETLNLVASYSKYSKTRFRRAHV